MSNDKFSDLDELFKPLPRWKYALYFPYRLWDRIENLWMDTIAFFQRGKRGYADKDTWDFYFYLAEVIAGGLKILKKHHSGYPIGLTNEKWNEILDTMIEGFESCVICEEFSEEKLDKALKLFAKHFLSLWD